MASTASPSTRSPPRVGVRKQTVLYWFSSKDELVDAVLAATASELGVVIDAAVRAAPDEPLARVDTVVGAAFRIAVRRPAVLGLVRELSRLPAAQADRLRVLVDPLTARAVEFLEREMAAGRLRRGDPRLVAALAYATVTGIATEPEALRGVGWTPTAGNLRALRNELRGFLRAALAPPRPSVRRDRLTTNRFRRTGRLTPRWRRP